MHPRKQVTQQDFVTAWQRSHSAKEVAEKLGLTVAGASVRATKLRKNGVPLKKFVTRRVDYEALARLAASLIEQPEGED